MKEKEKKEEKRKKATKERFRRVQVPILNLSKPPCPVLVESESEVKSEKVKSEEFFCLRFR